MRLWISFTRTTPNPSGNRFTRNIWHRCVGHEPVCLSAMLLFKVSKPISRMLWKTHQFIVFEIQNIYHWYATSHATASLCLVYLKAPTTITPRQYVRLQQSAKWYPLRSKPIKFLGRLCLNLSRIGLLRCHKASGRVLDFAMTRLPPSHHTPLSNSSLSNHVWTWSEMNLASSCSTASNMHPLETANGGHQGDVLT